MSILDIITPELLLQRKKNWVFISINPDLFNTTGHYLYFDQSLHKAVTSLDGEFISFTHQTFTHCKEHQEGWIEPVFSQKTVVTPWEGCVNDRVLFVAELREKLTKLCTRIPDVNIVAFLYSGHAHQLPLVVQALADIPFANINFVFNLYSAYFNFDEGSEEYQRGLLLAEKSLSFCSGLDSTERVKVVSDGVFAAALVEKHLRKKCPILPFFCLNPPTREGQQEIISSAVSEPFSSVTVSYLGFAHKFRGFTLLLDAVGRCLEHKPEINWKFIVRTGTNDNNVFEGNIPEQIQSLRALGVEIITGYLTQEEMEQRYRETDILLIPYQSQYFAHRTSAHTSDGLAHGLAMVATKNTWSGQLVEELGIGNTFDDGNSQDLGQAIIQTAENLRVHKQNSYTNGSAWLAKNNFTTVVHFLQSLPSPLTNNNSEARRVWEIQTLSVFNTYYSGLLLCLLTGLNANDIRPDHALTQITSTASQLGQPKSSASFFEFLNLLLHLQRSEAQQKEAIYHLQTSRKNLEEKNIRLDKANKAYAENINYHRKKIESYQKKIADLKSKIEKIKTKKKIPEKIPKIVTHISNWKKFFGRKTNQRRTRMRYLVDCSNYFGDNLNMGDVAIFTVMIRRIRANDPLAEIRWITRNPKIMGMLFDEKITWLDVGDALERDYFSSHFHKKSKLPSRNGSSEDQVAFLRQNASSVIHEKHHQIIKSVAWANVVIASGGGYFSDAFPQQAIGVLDTLAAGLLAGKTTALLGIGFENLSHERLLAKAKAILPRLDFIGCRENVFSPAFLENLGCSQNRLYLTGDDAVELACQSQTPTFGEALGVNLRKSSYSNVDDSAMTWLTHVVQTFAAKHHTSLLPIPISIYGPNDLQSIQEIIGTPLADTGDTRDSLEKILRNVSKCRVLLTGSYHAAVFALSQGIPVVALANSLHYNTKLAGLIQRFGGIGGRVIALSAPDAAESIRAGLEEFWEKAPQIREKLRQSAKSQTDLGREVYQLLSAT